MKVVIILLSVILIFGLMLRMFKFIIEFADKYFK